MTEYLSWGDTVVVADDAPNKFRPRERGSICGFREPKEHAQNLDHSAGTLALCLVEFPDGEAIEIPYSYLRKLS